MNPDESMYTYYDRAFALDGHTDVSEETLITMFNMNDAGLQVLAVAHPNFPFHIRFLYELKKYPPNYKIADMSCIEQRPEDYKKFLTDNKLTMEDMNHVPKAWLIALLEKQ